MPEAGLNVFSVRVAAGGFDGAVGAVVVDVAAGVVESVDCAAFCLRARCFAALRGFGSVYLVVILVCREIIRLALCNMLARCERAF